MKILSKKAVNDVFTRYLCPNCKTEYLYYKPVGISDKKLLSRYGFRRKPSDRALSVILAYCTNNECNALSVSYIDKNSDFRGCVTVKSVTNVFLDNILNKHKKKSKCKKKCNTNYERIIDLSTLGLKRKEKNSNAVLHYCTDCKSILLGYKGNHEKSINFSECISEVNITLLKNLSLLLHSS